MLREAHPRTSRSRTRASRSTPSCFAKQNPCFAKHTLVLHEAELVLREANPRASRSRARASRSTPSYFTKQNPCFAKHTLVLREAHPRASRGTPSCFAKQSPTFTHHTRYFVKFSPAFARCGPNFARFTRTLSTPGAEARKASTDSGQRRFRLPALRPPPTSTAPFACLLGVDLLPEPFPATGAGFRTHPRLKARSAILPSPRMARTHPRDRRDPSALPPHATGAGTRIQSPRCTAVSAPSVPSGCVADAGGCSPTPAPDAPV